MYLHIHVGGSVSRWDFIQGDSALRNNRTNKNAAASKLYRRKLQKRLMHHKQQLLGLQQAKKNFFSTKAEKAATSGATASVVPVAGIGSKETEHLLKTQEWMFKKQFKQYSSKVNRLVYS